MATAVVNIRTLRAPGGKVRPRPGVGGPFGPMLVPFGSGSGVVIDKVKGYIVTNHHVIRDADEVIVRLGRHAEYPAKVVGTDPKTDLAVLQIQAPLRVEAHWADSKTTDVGDWVLAIGSPYLLDQTVTAGIVSATGRNNLPNLNRDQYQDFIQTDAAVNPGNSGGPLINLQGEIVGINTAIFAPRAGQEEAGNVGIGMAISATMAKQVTDQLIKHGRVSRGYLGLAFEEVQADQAARLGLKDQRGVFVRGVEPDGPAAIAGIKPDDVVVRLAGQPIEDGAGLRNRTAALPVGSSVPLEIIRDRKPMTLTVTIGEWPILTSLGLRLEDARGEAARRFPGQPEQVVLIVDVLPVSEARRAGLLPGMRVVKVGNTLVASKADCQAAAAALDPGEGVPIEVQIDDGRKARVVLGGTRSHSAR